ncbi:4Fe-4S binding protein [Inhella crocodyli]|uniref:4Fe-4S binding protein n=1 Tax=Inhella crocodyli TaxID=2499851 RepID=A0A3S2XXF0_9BURK|nr:4Fe-4S binding protein [Inhella crocodyli]RVT88708.1 4Fe-4S binding protein [Inhella crocodyli]
MSLQARRRALQLGFFALFLSAPALNLLRFDLHEAQLWVLGLRWSLGIDAFRAGQLSANEVALSILLRGIVPALALIVGFLWVAYRWGRLYCGWLCPHFSLVEGLNALLVRASGKLSLWDRQSQPGVRPQARYWPVFVGTALFFGFAWSITLLTYLLPPAEIWGGLWRGTLTPNQTRFLLIAWAVFSAELLFARHLFCRFGCAVGFFQSLAWMANRRALVVGFARARAAECRDCSPAQDACENACPMRLRPRNLKRLMFSCVQCGQCLQACDRSHAQRGASPTLVWTVGADALRETLRHNVSQKGKP